MNLILCLTEQCNLRCTYCYYKDTQAARHAVMDNATLEQAIRVGLERTHSFGQNLLIVSFFGGEPLLRRIPARTPSRRNSHSSRCVALPTSVPKFCSCATTSTPIPWT